MVVGLIRGGTLNCEGAIESLVDGFKILVFFLKLFTVFLLTHILK